MTDQEVREAIVDDELEEGDPCPGLCGGHLQIKDEDGTKWLQCSQRPGHYALAPV